MRDCIPARCWEPYSTASPATPKRATPSSSAPPRWATNKQLESEMNPSEILAPLSRSYSYLREMMSGSDARNLFIRMLDESLTDATILFRSENQDSTAGLRRNDSSQADIVIRVLRERFFSQVLCYGNLGLGEAFMNGDCEMENCRLHDFWLILLRNRVN